MPDKLIDKAVELLRSTQDTPYKIAKATGLSQTIIGKWKKGEGKPSRANARYILQYFSIPNIEDQPISQGGEDVTLPKAETNNLDTMERMKFFEALERRDQEVSRLITIIEKMQGITQGAESAAQKKEA